jgi:carbon-monoxide dehydrogenase iron sulfur subunit
VSGTILVRHERCVACKRCRIACIVENSASRDLYGATLEPHRSAARITVAPRGRRVIPAACRHCDAAACIIACPSGAISRSGPREPVVLRKERCVGCQDCVLACPYGVPRLTADRAEVVKCDQCIERLARGRVPACVEACPTGTLQWRDDQDSERMFDKSPLWESGVAEGSES